MEFGLIGKSLQHSFSRSYFTEKFTRLGLPHTYHNFELPCIELFPSVIEEYPGLRGLNVTAPYKESVIPFLDEVHGEARDIGAVNTILIKDKKLAGYNTDGTGFEKSLAPLLRPCHTRALILGSGGAGKAVKYVFRKRGIAFREVSRNPTGNQVSYAEASSLLQDHFLVINTTPAGTFPRTGHKPPLALEEVNDRHFFYDLIYNPKKTLFLQEAERQGATVKNGLEMLHIQAEKAWEIWME